MLDEVGALPSMPAAGSDLTPASVPQVLYLVESRLVRSNDSANFTKSLGRSS